VLLGTWFGVGLLPAMSGTWASLAALPCAWVIRSWCGGIGLAVATAIIFVVGYWASAKVAEVSATRDPSTIVIDEVAGQWLVLLGAALDPLSYFLAFLTFRIFDIWKPWPVCWADRHLGGGLGIMLDDLLASVYALLVLSVLLVIGGAIGVRN
jgi:phosphatidylglycerophosphatase A